MSSLVIGAALLGGGVGFAVTEDTGFGGGVFQSLVTMTTLGWSPFDAPTTVGGQITLAGVLVTGVAGLFGAGIALVTESVDLLGSRRWMGETDHRDHQVVCGYGRIGRVVASALAERGDTVVIVDSDKEAAEEAEGRALEVVLGDAGDDETLRRAGVADARGLITTFDDDARNVFVVVSAKSLSETITTAATASTSATADKLRLVGVDHVVATEVAAGRMLARSMSAPLAVDLFLGSLEEGEFREVIVESDSELVGATVEAISDAGERVVLAYRSDDEAVVAPDPTTEIRPGMRLLIHDVAARRRISE